MEQTVKTTADIAGTPRSVTSRTITVELAARRGTRQTCVKRTYVSDVNLGDMRKLLYINGQFYIHR